MRDRVRNQIQEGNRGAVPRQARQETAPHLASDQPCLWVEIIGTAWLSAAIFMRSPPSI